MVPMEKKFQELSQTTWDRETWEAEKTSQSLSKDKESRRQNLLIEDKPDCIQGPREAGGRIPWTVETSQTVAAHSICQEPRETRGRIS